MAKRTKRANGEGSISFDASRNRFRAEFVDPIGKRVAKRFKTRDEAVAWLTTARADVYKGEYVQRSDITVGEWVEEYLEVYKKPSVKIKTFADYLNSAKYLAPLVDIPLQDVDPATIQKFYTSLTVSSRTKIQVHRFLKGAFSKAIELGMIKKNPLAAVTAPRQSAKEEVEVLTIDEIIALMQAVSDSKWYARYYPLFRLALNTGMRIGEIVAVKVANIKGKKLTINSEVVEISGSLYHDTPKTDHSIRTITLDDDTLNVLRPLLDSNYTYVFRTKTDTPIPPNQVRRAWRKVLEIANIPYRKFHALRHTNATLLLAAGIPIIEVSKRLGHAKVSYTLDLYGHAIPNKDEEIANQVATIFKS